MANPAMGNVGTPLPQTAQDNSQGGPFIRYAREAARPGYSRAGDAFGSTITNALSSAPGYLRGLWITVVASGGVAGGTNAVASADAPYNTIQFLQLKDPWGTPIVTIGGWELAQIINPYSGQCGIGACANPGALPSFSAVATSGNFTYKVYVPLEATKGYGVISIGNSSVMPTLFIQYAPAATVYSTLPGTTTPTLAITVDEDYYDVDPTMPVEPPGNGTTLQWSIAQGDQSIGSGSSTRVKLPHTGGYLTTLALILRDSTNARIDGYNLTGRIRLYIDGIPQYDLSWIEAVDRLFFETIGAFTRPTGVMVFGFKRSLSQVNLGLLDTLEQAQQTTPGTQIEIEMTPWGTIANAPATLSVVYGQIVPAGRLQQGLIEA